MVSSTPYPPPVPYAFLALQARPNSFSHSEVDFGTLVWSAWGARLLADFGYGTIATAVGEWDTRRYEYIDNNRRVVAEFAERRVDADGFVLQAVRSHRGRP